MATLESVKKKFHDGGMGLFPSAYVWSMRRQVAPKPLTRERLLEALSEDGHNIGFTLEDAALLLEKFVELKHVTLKREAEGTYLKWGCKGFKGKVPPDDYYILEEDEGSVTIAVDLRNGYPSSKHIYRLTRRTLQEATR